MDLSVPVITEEIQVDHAPSPGHFWPYYRKLKPAPPLYDRCGNLTLKYRPHIAADEEDPSYSAKFDQTRFVYPIQKAVQKSGRLPTSQSMRPAVVAPAKVLSTQQDAAGATSGDRKDMSTKKISVTMDKTEQEPEPDAGKLLSEPMTAFRADHTTYEFSTRTRQKTKNQKPEQHGLQFRVNQLQHRGVPISKERLRFLDFVAKKRKRVKDYETTVNSHNKQHSERYKNICAARTATLQESVKNAQAVCQQSALDQMTAIRRFRQLSGTVVQVTQKSPLEAAVESLP